MNLSEMNPTASGLAAIDEAALTIELQCWVRDRLRSAKTPTGISVRGDFPFNEQGKLLRRELRDEAQQKLALASGQSAPNTVPSSGYRPEGSPSKQPVWLALFRSGHGPNT